MLAGAVLIGAGLVLIWVGHGSLLLLGGCLIFAGLGVRWRARQGP